MADNNKENRMSIDDFDFAHEDANDDTSMLVNYLVTRLHQAMGNPALQGKVQQQLHAYGILPPIQQERGPERFQGETSKRGLSTEKGVENPYQELKQLLEGKPSSKNKGHAQQERSPSREREESDSSDESMEDVAPRQRRAQRSPTPTKRKRSPHSPHRRESKREEKNSKKKKERKRSPSSPSSSPSSSSDEGSGYSSQERQRRGHRRSYAACKRSSKLKKFKEGGKNISFLTYNGTFGATDKDNNRTGSLCTATQEKKLLLKQVQLPTFKGEGPNIERDVEAWIEAMDDYFLAAGSAPKNQAMLGMFRLMGDAKLWWKQHCRDNPIASPSKERMKQAEKERYLPPAHQAIKMNEFFALRQLGLTLEEYYSKFVSLRRYAPQMTMEQQIARFCQGLNRPLSTRLEAMRPTSIQDALIKAKPLVTELNPSPRTYNQLNNLQGRVRRTLNQGNQQHGTIAATTMEQIFPNVRCFECNQWGHYRTRCPRIQHSRILARVTRQPQIIQGNNLRGGSNGGHDRGRGRGRGARVYATVGSEPTLQDEEEDRATLLADN
ncbi:hypothetical protein L7F22_066353 [Adiantum nelumboides]|nr:hypothetical protein [Adiantum nelumboides]